MIKVRLIRDVEVHGTTGMRRYMIRHVKVHGKAWGGT